MSHPLEQRIATLRARVRRLVAVYGVCWVVAAVLGAVIVLGMADYLVRFQDRGIRVICSLLVLGALGWTCYRYLYLPLTFRLREVDLAGRLQRRFPGLDDRLVSTVEFLRQSEDDPLAGSAALRRAVIAETTAETDRLDFSDVLDRRPPGRAATVSAAVCLVAAILVVLDYRAHYGHRDGRLASRIALARLVNPFGSDAFPQKTHLKLRKRVVRLARGDTFEVEVIDERGAKLPAHVRIHYRFEGPDGTVTEQSDPMQRFVEKSEGRKGDAQEVMIARRDNVVRSFSYRIQGGDDNTSIPWISVEVLEPPEIKALTIWLTPPPYTGWPREKSGRNVRALVGTRMELTARTTKPLRSAVLCLDGGVKIPGRVSGDGYHFSLPAPDDPELVIERSGAYWFRLSDRQEITGGRDSRWEIRAVPDSPPTVSIEDPTDNLFVTSRAAVPLRITAKDDLAVRRVTLVFSRADLARPDGPPQDVSELPLYLGPGSVDPQPAGSLADAAELGDLRVVESRWELADLELPPGAQLTFHATATDYRPQTGASQPRRLTVITPEELNRRIADRQSLVLAELARVLKMQRGCRAQVAALEIRLEEVGRIEQRDLDHLQGAELNQRQVSRDLTSRSDGVPAHILALLADLENNKVDSPDISRRMYALLDEIDRLEREHLAAIGRELTGAIKGGRAGTEQASQPPRTDPAVAGSLAAAGKHQDQVIASLERLLDQLGQWDNYRRFHREVGQVLRDQEDLMRRSSDLGRHTLAKQPKDLRPQERADLRVLTGRQLELAWRLERIEQEMEQAAGQLQQSDPLAAETVADALAEARRLAISGQMRTSGGHLERNQMGQAVERQQQIIEALRDVLDILANRREHELARLVKKLEQAERDLAEIERQQEGLRKKLEENSQQPDDAQRRRELERLTRRQEQLQQETERMARRLQRLLAEQAGRTAAQAAGQMGQAAQSAGQGDSQGASRAAAAAQKSLAQARRQLAQLRLQAQTELALEQLARLDDALKHLQRRQQKVIDETRRYHKLWEDNGGLTRAQATGLHDLARQQNALRSETDGLGEKLVGAGAFNLALSGAAREMGRAAALLTRQQTGPPTQRAEQNALGGLEMLLEALKPEEPDADSGSAVGSMAGQGGMPGGGGVHTLAELKLLRLLQEDVNRRTAELQQAVAAAETLTDEHQREYVALSEDQGKLANLVWQLLQVQEQNPEDDPAGLPDLTPQQEKQPRPGPLELEDQLP